MKNENIRNQLTSSLLKLYQMNGVGVLLEFLEGEMAVLVCIANTYDQDITPSFLSERIHVSRARITAILTSLRDKGYIDMKLIEDDRRKMRVIMTEVGLKYYQEKEKVAQQYFDVFIDKIGENKVNYLIELINQIIIAMDDVKI